MEETRKGTKNITRVKDEENWILKIDGRAEVGAAEVLAAQWCDGARRASGVVRILAVATAAAYCPPPPSSLSAKTMKMQ